MTTSPVIDPDCRAGKHRACVGGRCECPCHSGADMTDPRVGASIAPPLTPAMRADLRLLLQPAVDAVAADRRNQRAASRRRRRAA